MGAGFSKALAQPMAPARVVVANRSAERAAAVAEQSGADVVSLSRLDEELGMADIVLTSTSAAEVVLDAARVGRTMRSRPGRPLLVVDVAVPRDVDPAVADVEGVSLLDVEDVRRFAEAHMSTRRGEIPAVRAVLTEELERYRTSSAARSAAPVVAALRTRPSRSVAPSSHVTARSSMRSATSARDRRTGHSAHRSQAPPRADGADQGRCRLAARRKARRGAAQPVRL